MSDEGRRDVKAMLAMLESDGPFDHTEGLLSNENPGLLGTDFLGYAWRNRRIAELEKQLAEEKAKHGGTQAEAAKLRKLIATKLRTLQGRSTTAFEHFEAAFRAFIKEIDHEDHILQVENDK
jgi:hypothetical protein